VPRVVVKINSHCWSKGDELLIASDDQQTVVHITDHTLVEPGEQTCVSAGTKAAVVSSRKPPWNVLSHN